MLEPAQHLTMRSATAQDQPLLFALFCADRQKQFAALRLAPQQLQPLFAAQFRARQEDYARRFPAAIDTILCLADGTPAGRHLVHRQPGAYRGIDLAVLPHFQNRGLGTQALMHMQQLARAENAVCRLRVLHTNPALRLYERLGFERIGADELSYEMQWVPESRPPSRQAARRSGRKRTVFDDFRRRLNFPGSRRTSSAARGAVGAPTRSVQGESAADLICHFVPGLASGSLLQGRHGGTVPFEDFAMVLPTRRPPSLRSKLPAAALGIASLIAAAHLQAQGVLTITPARSTSTAAGTGAAGLSGDGGAAAAATFARPSAVAYDAAGNLYIADANNHVVRELVRSTGNIATVAGSGVAGFSGDGGAATAAQLDTPTGVALDSSGNLYIADSHNNRIRRVAGGTISTLAGGGTVAGTAATSTGNVRLLLPTAVAVDASGSVYVADTNNNVVRKIAGTAVTTVAGTGEQGFTGDGGAATAAALDSPTGIAVDASGTLYIADRLNQRLRTVNSAGLISTLAGSGVPTFSGGFAGDGGSAAAASLSRPTGVSLDANGNVYVADTSNQRIRQVGNGGIATVSGNGEQGSTTGALNLPLGVALDAGGNVGVADSLNERILAVAASTLTFVPQGVGVASPTQTITLGNSGTGALTLSQLALSAGFTLVPGGTCSATPITLAAGATCTVNVGYTQTASGPTSGVLNVSGTNVPTQSVELATAAVLGGGSVGIGTAASITAAQPALLTGETTTYTVRVAAQSGLGTPSGNVTLTANGVLIGSATLNNGAAQVSTSYALAGPQSIVATYSGNAVYAASTTTFAQTVRSFSFAVATSGAGATQNVGRGATATFLFTVTPQNGTFPYPVTFAATGVPTGATVTFTPTSVLPNGSGAVNVTMAVKVPATFSMLRQTEMATGGSAVFALLLLPFCAGTKRAHLRKLLLVLLAVGGLGASAVLTGCGSSTGATDISIRVYNLVVTATGTAPDGATLQQTATVQVTVH